MPTTDANLASLNNTGSFKMFMNNFQASLDEQLKASRKLFMISRTRVENLKNRRNSIKRWKNIEKPGDDDWITSGSLGSRDAVLVFRTAILNSRNKLSLSQKSSQNSLGATQTPSANDSSSPSSNGTTSPLNKTTTTTRSHSNVEKVVGKANSKTEPLALSKQLKESISSSDNSISSDGETTTTSTIIERPKTNVIHIAEDEETEEEENDADANKSTNCDTNCGIVSDDFNDDYAEGEEGREEDDSAELVPHSPDMPALDLRLYFKFMQTETKLLRRIFVRHGLTEVESDENFSILWTGVHLKPDILRNLAPYQRVNHFPRSYEITRKDRMYKNIERMQHLRGYKHFDIVPQSFVLPLEYRDLVSAHNKTRGPWIVKPAASSRGRGIFIVNSPDQIPQEEQVLVSKYVSDPLCIDGHKCDLRVYVLVTSFDPLIVYIYEEGLVRLATVKYDRHADNLWNPCMHLCNYSINKYHSDYIKSSDAQDEDVGHKWTLSALLRHLQSQGCDIGQLMLNIEDLIIKSLLACAQSVISACRMFVPNGNNCFELYGFDILIDDSLKPWLLEVNLSPSMGVDSPLDAKVKASLITDLLTCVGIPAYSAQLRAHYDSKWTRYRNISYSRRTNSADPPSGGGGATAANRRNSSAALPPLTLEEQRIVRNARLQNVRRGGFVRIFPTEDSMQRYGSFLDPSTGIAMSTPTPQGQMTYSMILPHNYNQMLFNHLYGKGAGGRCLEDNSQAERLAQYTRALATEAPIYFRKKREEPKCEEEGKRLRKQVLKLIDTGSELTQLQARQAFALYLEAVLRRLSVEPKDHHEKLILKFLNRVGGAIKAPVFFRNPQTIRIISKARSAMIAKLLGDFLEQYTRDTEAYVDSFDHFGMIPTSLYSEFLSQAQEADLEAVLVMNTNVSGNMPYLYNRCGLSVPPTPPIPSGVHGFLRALPAMVISGSGAREFNKYDGYYRSLDKELIASSTAATATTAPSFKPDASNAKKALVFHRR